MGVSLRYTRRHFHVEGTPRSQYVTWIRVEPDPNPLPVFRLWRFWPTRRRPR